MNKLNEISSPVIRLALKKELQKKLDLYGPEWVKKNWAPTQFCLICKRIIYFGVSSYECECSIWTSIVGLRSSLVDQIKESPPISVKLSKDGNYHVRSTRPQLLSLIKNSILVHRITNFRMTKDSECIDAWLGLNEAKDGSDHADPETAAKQSLRQLVGPPGLLIISGGQKMANREGANVLHDTLDIRLQSESPTWFWDRIGHEFGPSCVCYNDNVVQLLQDEFEYINLGVQTQIQAQPNKVIARDLNSNQETHRDPGPLFQYGQGLSKSKSKFSRSKKNTISLIEEDVEDDF